MGFSFNRRRRKETTRSLGEAGEAEETYQKKRGVVLLPLFFVPAKSL
jgi:hypothetical protein